jgi:flagellin
MNANRNLNVTTASQARSTEKLSTGYKINRAADDAAGLSISEKMRRQIRGLTQASSNAQDGISSVQTAEGALTEVHDMLQRMDQIATKAANGTMSVSDRQNVQDEIDSLLTEIDRVSETTKFNEIYLLKGEPGKANAGSGSKVDIFLNAHDAGLDGFLSKASAYATSVTFQLNVSVSKQVSNAGSGNAAKITIGGVDYNVFKDSATASKARLNGVDNAITQGKAVSKMKEALSLANNVGTDAGMKASVTVGNSGKFTIKLGKVKVTKALNFDFMWVLTLT